MTAYPDRHHPCYFLEDELHALGADAVVVRNEQTLGCWGLIVNGKVMVWLIDNRHAHEAAKEDPAAAELLKRGDLVMCAQKPDAERIGAKWLPLAVSPTFRTPDNSVEKLYDVTFVGYVRDAGRCGVLSAVARRFKTRVLQGIFGDDAVSAYWHSHIAINVPTGYGQADAYDSANMRLFECLATGTPMMTSYEPYLHELGLECNVHHTNYLFYKNVDDLIEKIEVQLTQPQRLTEIGRAGAALANERHTYEHRAQQVLDWLK